MCFSANASFTAAAVLTVVGVASISQVRKPSHLIFASMPLMFAIQQFFEGFVWLSLSNPHFYDWHNFFKYAFLLFAQIIWPTWIPLSFLTMETSPNRRKILQYFTLAGFMCTFILAYRLIFSTAVAEIDGCHIEYEIASTENMLVITGILYILSIVVAPFFSTRKRVLYLASANVISLIVTQLFFEVYLVSVWCFFAAAQSVLVFWIVRGMRKENTA